MATYVNNLRLKEIATGDESGTWGTSTNTNLELIGQGLGYGTEQVAADSNETFTMADGVADGMRGMYLKFTSAGALTATRTLTLAPNTISKVWIIENATTGSQIITIKQGSGATVNVANGDRAFLYTDGAGAGAAVLTANPSEAGGTVTSVAVSGGSSGLSTSGGPITTSGTITIAGTLVAGNGGTGLTSLGTGIPTWWGTPSSANLASAVTDETGSGSLVFATSPTFVTPALGTPSSGTATNLTGLPPAGVTGTAAILGANTFTALQTQAAGADIASATAVDLTGATGNTVVITGTTESTSLTMTAGQQMILIAAAAWPLTFHATTMNITGGVSYTCAAGDRLYVTKDVDNVIRVSVLKQDGTAVAGASAGATFEAVASGAISNGDTVIINADGTVSAVSGTGAVSSLGADSEFEATSSSAIQACYDTSTDRVVVVYKSGSYVTAQVGQVTGTDITWGADTTIGTANSGTPAIAYDVNTSRVVVVYLESASVGTDYLYSAVGTVTGGGTNTIAFGTETAVKSAASRYPAIVYLAATNKMVVLWHKDGSPYDGECVCGTVTGGGTNTMAVGTEVTIGSNRHFYLTRGCFYDSDAERVIACYTDWGSSENGRSNVIENTTGTTLTVSADYEFNPGDVTYVSGAYDTDQNKGIVMFRDTTDTYMKAVVMTIVGGGTNSITMGVEVVVVSLNTQHIESGFDQTANKVVSMFYGNDSQGSVITGTVSGTGASATSTWDAALEVCPDYLQYPGYAYDPDAGKSILCYQDGSDSESGHSKVFTVGYGSTNLTSENYIGISDAAYSDTETATIQIVSAVDDAQSSLTPGQTYYISFDGSLVLTPIDPSVVAGTAVSGTKLIVKG